MPSGAKPLAIDLYCGLGGWADGLLAEGFDVIGFDIERHIYGEHRYPAQLVIQDVRTLHGRQFRNATLIVASPPCQAYSYRAMPWKRAKALPPPDNELFETCFRIQREACEAAGHHIPLIVENVKGAQPWVGRSRWNFGSFYLWGDVPALMPPIGVRKLSPRLHLGGGNSFKANGRDDARHHPRHADRRREEFKNTGGSWFAVAHNTTSGKGRNPDGRKLVGPKWDPATKSGAHGMPRWTTPSEGVKHHGSGAVWFDTGPAALPSSSPRRKFASAMIAKIPLPLSRHIAATFYPRSFAEAAE